MFLPKHISLGALAAILLPVVAVAASEWRIDWHSLDGGGLSTATGGGLALGGTVGQVDAGPPMHGQGWTLTGGFWSGADAAVGPADGDCDRDGDVDVADHACLAACLAGPDAAANVTCGDADFDGSGTVDLADWQALQSALTG